MVAFIGSFKKITVLNFLTDSINSKNLSKVKRFLNYFSHVFFLMESNALITARAMSTGFSNSPVPFIHLPSGFYNANMSPSFPA